MTKTLLFLVFLGGSGVAMTLPALAVPPTVQPSPGYDSRLEQSRRQAYPKPVEPADRVKKHHRKHRH